jgi:hypothetical protein
MGWGVSTLTILQSLFETMSYSQPHVVIDPYQSSVFGDAALSALRNLAISESVEFYGERSELVLPELVKKGRHFDFVFVDGDHKLHSVFTDFRSIDLLLEPGGIVVFDDVNLGAVKFTFRYAADVLRLRAGPQVCCTGQGEQVCSRIEEKDLRKTENINEALRGMSMRFMPERALGVDSIHQFVITDDEAGNFLYTNSRF